MGFGHYEPGMHCQQTGASRHGKRLQSCQSWQTVSSLQLKSVHLTTHTNATSALTGLCLPSCRCAQDSMHVAPAVAMAKLGYNMLLEKPMAVNIEECCRIVAAVKKAGVIFATCHVLRCAIPSRQSNPPLRPRAAKPLLHTESHTHLPQLHAILGKDS